MLFKTHIKICSKCYDIIMIAARRAPVFLTCVTMVLRRQCLADQRQESLRPRRLRPLPPPPGHPRGQGTDHCPSLFVWKKFCGRNVIATVWADIMGELSQDNLFHLHPPVEYVAVKTLTNQTYRLHLDISRKNYSFSCIHFILIGYQYFG